MKWFQHTKKHICFSLSCYQFFGFFQWTSCLHGAFWQINIVAKSHKSVSKFTNTSFLFERTACKACFWKKIKNSIWNVSFVWSVSLPTWFFVWTNLMAKPRNVGEWRSQNSYTEAVVWRSRETFFSSAHPVSLQFSCGLFTGKSNERFNAFRQFTALSNFDVL